MSSHESSERPDSAERPDSQAPGEAAPAREPNAPPSSSGALPGRRDTPPVTPPGYDHTIPPYEPERHVPQGGEAESPALADILAETDAISETTYPDTTGTLNETEWVGQGGQLDNTVGESRIGLDQVARQHDEQAAPRTDDDATNTPDTTGHP
ncbi:MAG TPA: hypothetical protein VFU88_09355 [Ktedonobacterales bacterium]|nr:hypothetical protein [Ktedonobacterales bacterium]